MKNLINYLDDYLDDVSLTEQCCNKQHKKIGTHEDMIKANRKASREEEIENHGKPINHNNVYRDKSKYNRKDKHKKRY